MKTKFFTVAKNLNTLVLMASIIFFAVGIGCSLFKGTEGTLSFYESDEQRVLIEFMAAAWPLAILPLGITYRIREWMQKKSVLTVVR